MYRHIRIYIDPALRAQMPMGESVIEELRRGPLLMVYIDTSVLRTGQITEAQGKIAWQKFEQLCNADLHLLPAEPATFHRAAILALDVKTGSRAGDALHLAAALESNARTIATLDDVLANAARQMKRRLVKR